MRIALGLEYDGSAFCGWQSQVHGVGVQSVVERALACVADHSVDVVAAGRTDTGVHATMQVVHFDTTAQRTPRGWILGTTSNLPRQVTALWAREVPESFHARFSALNRSYRYFILNRPTRPAIGADYVSWVREPLDAAPMHAAAQSLIGDHDFSSFRAAECQARTARRLIHELSVVRRNEFIELTVTANSFLHHMVRNIAGVLIAIGTGERPTDWAAHVLNLKDRSQGGVTAPPGGLYLTGVQYPEAFQLPNSRSTLFEREPIVG